MWQSTGLSDKILLVLTGEFGRTPPRIDGYGRPRSLGISHAVALAGGGLKMGQVVGESSAKAEVPKTLPFIRRT